MPFTRPFPGGKPRSKTVAGKIDRLQAGAAKIQEAITPPGGFKAGAARVVGQIKKDPLQFTPLSMREQAVPVAKTFFGQLGKPQLGEDVGYGLRGGLRLTPFQRGKDTYEPTTARQKKAQRVGQAAVGTAMTAPIGGPTPLANIFTRAAQGVALGTGIKAVSNIARGEPITTDLKEAATGGIETSWQLAFTYTITDKFVGKFFPKLLLSQTGNAFKLLKNASSMGVSNEIKKKLLFAGAKTLFLRALAEVPAETTLFTFTSRLNDKEKESFVSAWMKNLPGTTVGNLLFAGAEVGLRGTINFNRKQIDSAMESINKTFKDQSGKIQLGPDRKSIDQLAEESWGFKKPGVKQEFENAIVAKDAEAVNRLLPDVPEAFRKKHATAIDELIKPSPLPSPIKKPVPPQARKGAKKPSRGVVKAEEKYAYNINKIRLDIGDEAKKRLDQTVDKVKPELQKVKGETLTDQEVLEAAQSSDLLRKTVSREQTKKFTTQLTRLRQKVALGAEGKGIDEEFIKDIKVLSSWAADTGRRLQKFSIDAEPTAGPDIKEKLVKDLLKLGKDTDAIIKASNGVDFNNPKQVTEFYRKFVKPSMNDILDEYRYANLLSSPKTHIVNAFSNLLQTTVVAPGTKLYSGAIDFITSGLTKKQRQHYVREVPVYAKGMFSSVGEAVKGFSDAMKGKKFVERPDIKRIPTGVKILKPFKIIPQLLEASDVFFRTLIKSGEAESLAYKAFRQGKTRTAGAIDKQAAERAAYYVFRGAIDPKNLKGQGKLLSGLDQATKAAYGARRVPGVKWFIPFIQTPMNILKQGIEYSPAGILTTIGAKDPIEQTAKALMGSTVMLGAGWIAAKGDVTWAAPTGKKEKEVFYASGRKPYSIRIGDKWIGYSRIGPLAYPIAMAAAVKYFDEKSPTALSDSQSKKLVKIVGNIAGFFSDQSYVQGIGNLIKAVEGEEYAWERLASNIPRQLVPLTSLQGWIARIIDPVYRKAETPIEQILAGIPELSKQLQPYTTPSGKPSKREKPLLEAVSPVGVTSVQSGYETRWQYEQSKKQRTKKLDKLKEEVKKKQKSGQKSAGKFTRSFPGSK